MAFIKKSKKITPNHKHWDTCKCNECDNYRKQVIAELEISKNILKVS